MKTHTPQEFHALPEWARNEIFSLEAALHKLEKMPLSPEAYEVVAKAIKRG